MTVRLLLSVFALAALAGCASPSPPPPPPPVAAPAAAAPAPASPSVAGGAAAFDGVYRPTSSSGVGVSSRTNCTNAMSTLRVHNGEAAMTWRGTMHGQVGADGSLDMKTGESHLYGQIANGAFNGKLETPACAYTVTLTKS